MNQSRSESPASPAFTISPAESHEDIAAVNGLFQAYVAWLDLDLTFQGFADELATLPGRYGPPNGALLLARLDATGEAIGCVAVRPYGPHRVCEMKRLYVSPAGRGSGVGRALAHKVIGEARRLSYRAIRLDTLPSMESARALYEQIGFKVIEAYYQSPLEGTIFLELELQ